MASSNMAVSIISYNRSHLLDLCLSSVQKAMQNQRYPVYVYIQDISPSDEAIFSKYTDLISSITKIASNNRDIENLINSNRILAWEQSLLTHNHDYVICLEDDVEISPDFFMFTEQVLIQNAQDKDFMGINYGSFEKNLSNGSYSKIRYGIHGPASLISHKALVNFQIRTLKKLKGKIAWDSWVEPIAKIGFMATSNIAKYNDNGVNGTHTSSSRDDVYFTKLEESFRVGLENPIEEVVLRNAIHSWRADCIIFLPTENFKYFLRKKAMRLYQYLRIFR
jgi:hypothetical protein